MEERIINNGQIQDFSDYLVGEERSNATCEKYIRDVRNFWVFAGNGQVTKELVVAWKKKLMEQGYAVRSINSMLASVNSFLGFLGWHGCKVKNIRLQQQTYCAEEKELTNPLKFFYNDQQRIAYSSDGVATSWWLRTPNSWYDNVVCGIDTNGVIGSGGIGSLGEEGEYKSSIRPAFCLKPDIPVLSIDAGYILAQK